MDAKNIFEKGSGYFITGGKDFSTLPFELHKEFTGVALKHLVVGEETEGRLSCHLVRIDPFCCLESHTHPKNLEIHEVIAGRGVYRIGEVEYPYQPGSVAVIPMDSVHRIVAGKEGLFILATFSPALK